MTQVLNIKDNEVKSVDVISAQAFVIWTGGVHTIRKMVESGWLVVTEEIDIEQSTYPEVLDLLTDGVIYFR